MDRAPFRVKPEHRMSHRAPHFLLYCDAPMADEQSRGWRFVLQTSNGDERLEAADVESEQTRSRLELLSVVRGLEALDQPSRVTLVTSSRYVGAGLHHGLEQWRQTDYQWDHFGVMTSIKNEDLWRRLDQALDYHELECRVRRGANVPADLSERFRVDRSHLAGTAPCSEPFDASDDMDSSIMARPEAAACDSVMGGETQEVESQEVEAAKSERSVGERSVGERSVGDRPVGDRPVGDRPDGDRPDAVRRRPAQPHPAQLPPAAADPNWPRRRRRWPIAWWASTAAAAAFIVMQATR